MSAKETITAVVAAIRQAAEAVQLHRGDLATIRDAADCVCNHGITADMTPEQIDASIANRPDKDTIRPLIPAVLEIGEPRQVERVCSALIDLHSANVLTLTERTPSWAKE